MALHPKPSCLLKVISSESMQMDLGSISTEEEILAEPDIPGLWSKDYKSYQVTAFLCQVLHTEVPGSQVQLPTFCSILCLPLLPSNSRSSSPFHYLKKNWPVASLSLLCQVWPCTLFIIRL